MRHSERVATRVRRRSRRAPRPVEKRRSWLRCRYRARRGRLPRRRSPLRAIGCGRCCRRRRAARPEDDRAGGFRSPRRRSARARHGRPCGPWRTPAHGCGRRMRRTPLLPRTGRGGSHPPARPRFQRGGPQGGNPTEYPLQDPRRRRLWWVWSCSEGNMPEGVWKVGFELSYLRIGCAITGSPIRRFEPSFIKAVCPATRASQQPIRSRHTGSQTCSRRSDRRVRSNQVGRIGNAKCPLVRP